VANAVVPLGDIKLFLGVTDSDSDDVLEAICDGIILWMENRTQRTLNGSTAVVYKTNGNGGLRLWLRDPPTSFTSIEERDEPDLKTWTVIDAADYEQDGRELVRIAGNTGITQGTFWPWGFKNLRISYTAGYDDTTFPADLMQLVKQMVALTWEKHRSTGLKAEKIGDYKVEFSEFETAADMAGIDLDAVLGPYTNISVH
jgi:hypothetical protein